jgi:hypothetical protein
MCPSSLKHAPPAAALMDAALDAAVDASLAVEARAVSADGRAVARTAIIAYLEALPSLLPTGPSSFVQVNRLRAPLLAHLKRGTPCAGS